MRCCLTNQCDVALLADFTSGREVVLKPGDQVFYEDTEEYPTGHTWDFVEWGWFKDEDIEYWPGEIHDWALEGF